MLVSSACASSPTAPKTTALRVEASPAEQEYETGSAFAARGDWVRAEQYFASAMRHGYPEERVITRLLQVCIGASRLRAALGYAEIYLLRHPDAWRLRYLTACIHVALDQLPDARRALQQVLQLQADQPEATRLLAEIQPDEAAPTARPEESAFE